MRRIALFFLLLASVLWGDWWLSVFLGLLFAALFQFPFELLLFGFWIDWIYGVRAGGQTHSFFVTMGALGVVLFSIFARNFLLFNGFSKKKTGYLRD